jgi:hypothetical protein
MIQSWLLLKGAITPPRGTIRTRALQETSALNIRGRRECRALHAPAASRAKNKKHTSKVTTGSLGDAGIPCASGFNGFLRALPGEPGFLATIPPEKR